MPTAPDKTRRSPRTGVSGVSVQLPVSGKVLNASLEGIAIETTESLCLGWSYAFKMTVGPKVVSIPGRVAWCERVGTRMAENGRAQPVFNLGVALVGSIWNKRQMYAYP